MNDNTYISKTARKENTSFMQVFDELKTTTIQRNNKRSLQWFINKIRSTNKTQQRITKPRIGGMYAFAYDAKTKDKLPYWDKTPLDIIVSYCPGGFYGLNFHYMSYIDRQILLKNLTVFDGSKSNYVLQSMSYRRLNLLAGTIWKFAFKRYLFSHMITRLVPVTRDEWNEAILLPIANFQNGVSAQSIWRETSSRGTRF